MPWLNWQDTTQLAGTNSAKLSRVTSPVDSTVPVYLKRHDTCHAGCIDLVVHRQ